MVRAAWVKPMTLVQKFEANEAVTACLQVVCQSNRYGEGYETKGDSGHPIALDGENPWGRDDKLYIFSNPALAAKKHDGNVCREPNYNLVYGNDGTFQGINGWWVQYQSDDDKDGITEVGDRVYWCNDEKYTIFGAEWYNYNHWGTVEKSSNRS